MGLKMAQKLLFEDGVEYLDKNGNKQSMKGVGFSYGTGTTYLEADSRLKSDKRARKAAGLRTGKRDTKKPASGADSAQVSGGTGKENAGDDRGGAAPVSDQRADEVP